MSSNKNSGECQTSDGEKRGERALFFSFFFLNTVSHSLSHLCVHSSVQHDCGCEKEQKQERESLPWTERDSCTLKQNGTADSGCSWTVTAVV